MHLLVVIGKYIFRHKYLVFNDLANKFNDFGKNGIQNFYIRKLL